MLQQFTDRDAELKFLEGVHSKRGFSLVVIYGRRRVGKTELIKKFIEDKKSAYVLLTNESLRENIRYIKEALADALQREYIRNLDVENLYDLFKLIEFEDERIVIVLDEFPHLLEINKGLLSVFQKIVDEVLSRTNVMLILSGSSLSMMENDVLGYRSPLYGRDIHVWKLQPFDFRTVYMLVGDVQRAAEVYFTFGNIPYYLKFYDVSKSLEENIVDTIMTKGAPLYEEPLVLLRQEFRESRIYRLILKYISLGYQSLGKLCSAMGMDKGNISKYLDTLKETGLVEHIIPYGKRRGGIYEISDPFVNLWFRFVYPYRRYLEIGRTDYPLRNFEEDKNRYFGRMFEKLIMELLIAGVFPKLMKYDGFYRWWRGEDEIDIVGISKGKILAVECKWQDGVDAKSVVSDLERKVQRMGWKGDVEYAVFAKSFDRRCENALTYDLQDMEKYLR